MSKRNWLGADVLASSFRKKANVQSIQTGEVTKGLTKQQMIVFGGIAVVGAIGIVYAIHYYLKQKEEKKKNAELVSQKRRAMELLDQKDSYFNEKIRKLQRRVYH